MGNSNSMISVTFDRTQPAIYYAGDVISGQVHFTVPERTGKIDEIYLTITGDVGYTTVRTMRMQNGQTDRVTDRHDIRVFGEKVLLGQAMSTLQVQASRSMNDMTTFRPGQYTYPFSIHLPDVLPPTLHPQDYPFVRYELQLCVEKKWYSANTQHRYPLRVYPRVNLLEINNSLCAIKFDTKRKDITIKGVIQRSGLVPGEQTTLSFEIYNPNNLSIKYVDICLIQRYEIEETRRRSEISRLSVPQLLNTTNEHIEATCPITIPMGIPPSYTYKGKGRNSNVHVNIHYDIKLEVKAKRLFSDFELQIPIIIGTDSAEHSSHTNMTPTLGDFNAVDTLKLEVDDDDVPSPS